MAKKKGAGLYAALGYDPRELEENKHLYDRKKNKGRMTDPGPEFRGLSLDQMYAANRDPRRLDNYHAARAAQDADPVMNQFARQHDPRVEREYQALRGKSNAFKQALRDSGQSYIGSKYQYEDKKRNRALKKQGGQGGAPKPGQPGYEYFQNRRAANRMAGDVFS